MWSSNKSSSIFMLKVGCNEVPTPALTLVVSLHRFWFIHLLIFTELTAHPLLECLQNFPPLKICKIGFPKLLTFPLFKCLPSAHFRFQLPSDFCFCFCEIWHFLLHIHSFNTITCFYNCLFIAHAFNTRWVNRVIKIRGAFMSQGNLWISKEIKN